MLNIHSSFASKSKAGLLLISGISAAYRHAAASPGTRFTVWTMPGACTLDVNDREYADWTRQPSEVVMGLTLSQVEHFYAHFNTDGLNLYVQVAV